MEHCCTPNDTSVDFKVFPFTFTVSVLSCGSEAIMLKVLPRNPFYEHFSRRMRKVTLILIALLCLFTLTSSNEERIALVLLWFDLNPNWLIFGILNFST